MRLRCLNRRFLVKWQYPLHCPYFLINNVGGIAELTSDCDHYILLTLIKGDSYGVSIYYKEL